MKVVAVQGVDDQIKGVGPIMEISRCRSMPVRYQLARLTLIPFRPAMHKRQAQCVNQAYPTREHGHCYSKSGYLNFCVMEKVLLAI